MALPVLSPAERGLIQQALGQLDDAQPRPQLAAGPASDLFEAFRAELVKAGVRRSLSYDEFAQSRAYKGWPKTVREVDDFLRDAFPQLKNKTQRLALLRFLIGALIDELREMEVPVTVTSVSNNMIRLPEVFNSAFPNYISSGLGHLVLESLQRKGK